jgi:hypothetical protein
MLEDGNDAEILDYALVHVTEAISATRDIHDKYKFR